MLFQTTRIILRQQSCYKPLILSKPCSLFLVPYDSTLGKRDVHITKENSPPLIGGQQNPCPVFNWHNFRCCHSVALSDKRSLELLFNKIKTNVRWKSRKSRREQEDDEDSDEDEDADDDYSDDDELPEFTEDEDLPSNSKVITPLLKSLRFDTLVAAGLNISRNRVDELFLQSKFSLNGGKVPKKKSQQLDVGDYVDLETAREDAVIKFKRVRILQCSDEETSKGKKKVTLRVWRSVCTREVDD